MKKSREPWEEPVQKTKRTSRQKLANVLVGVCSYIIIFLLLIAAITPKQYNLSVGNIAPETIKATKDVEDTITTELKRKEAREAVETVYKSDATVADRVLADMDAYFAALLQVNAKGEEIRQQKLADQHSASTPPPASPGEGDGRDDATPEPTATPTPEATPADVFSDEFISAMADIVPIELTDSEILAILEASPEELENLKNTVEVLAAEALDSAIKEEGLADQKVSIVQELRESSVPQSLQAVGAKAVSDYLQANLLRDEAATEAAQKQAEEAVQPIVYKKDQNIVRDGEAVTEAQHEMLKTLGLIQSNSLDILLYVGLAAFLAIIFVIFAGYLVEYETWILNHLPSLILLGVMGVLIPAFTLLANFVHPMLAPVAYGTLTIALLLKPRLAILYNVFASVMMGLIVVFTPEQGALGTAAYNLGFISILSGMAGISVARKSYQRSNLVFAGFILGLINALGILATGLMSSNNNLETFQAAGWGLVGGLLSAILTVGTMPIFESIFGLLTPLKLLELSNPTQPLMRKLLLEAPGTYHHSVVVGNLAERGAQAVGADGLLARVGAYYHDVGKLKQPYFFKENQMSGDNPHDRISPELSASIIRGHTQAGYQMSQKYKIPRRIQDIILQHHGTTLIKFFYYKAKQDNENVDPKDYRYPGPRPQSREAAVVMLADSIEAAVRTIKEPNQEKIREMMGNIVRDKLSDGQLDECDLTLKDLTLIQDAFMQVLTGVIHERIEYPKMDDAKEGSK